MANQVLETNSFKLVNDHEFHPINCYISPYKYIEKINKLLNLPQELLSHKSKEDQVHEDQLHCPGTVLKIQVKSQKNSRGGK